MSAPRHEPDHRAHPPPGDDDASSTPFQTQGVFNVAKKLTEKLRKKGMVTRKERAGGAGGAGGGGGGDEGGGDSDYEIREDGVELTEKDVVRRKTGTWATVTTEEEKSGGGAPEGDGDGGKKAEGAGKGPAAVA